LSERIVKGLQEVGRAAAGHGWQEKICAFFLCAKVSGRGESQNVKFLFGGCLVRSVDGFASALREVAPAMFEAARPLESPSATAKMKNEPSAVVKTIDKVTQRRKTRHAA
jgi:hypothetical protein